MRHVSHLCLVSTTLRTRWKVAKAFVKPKGMRIDWWATEYVKKLSFAELFSGCASANILITHLPLKTFFPVRENQCNRPYEKGDNYPSVSSRWIYDNQRKSVVDCLFGSKEDGATHVDTAGSMTPTSRCFLRLNALRWQARTGRWGAD